MRIWASLLFLFAWQSGEVSPVFSLITQFDRLAAQPLWPGFDARKTPLELYDGANTYLVRHPSPPEEFRPVAGHPDFRVYPGRHSMMRANTTIELAGHLTATLAFNRADTAEAAVLVHECFHVFQAQNHPFWSANEVALFTYPIDNPKVLALARMEMEALARALKAPRPECWVTRALTLRRERFAWLAPDAVAYERGTELHEGLAQYVQDLAQGRKEVPFRVFAPDEIRQRGYVAGEALARLLDRMNPGWKSKITGPLDESFPALHSTTCHFTALERKAFETQARVDVDKLKRRRAEIQQAFDAQPGWRVTVQTATGKPLLLDGFDPVNVIRLSDRTTLHKRWLKLSNDAGSLEILNHVSITEAAGKHPLFDGVLQWTAAGLSARPEVKQDGAHVTVTSPAINLDFSNATVETQGESIRILLQ
jgi:hypothetical protein